MSRQQEEDQRRYDDNGEDEARSAGDGSAPDNEYYHFLNVPRSASDQDINAAYKRLSKLYHPDKHLDPENKKKAEMLFSKLKLAHEVLIDPHKRAIYDCLGKKGLKEQGWQLVERTKTPRELREEYELLAKERAERRLQQRTNPTSRLQMTINATDLFERYLYEDDEYDVVADGGLPSFEISEISFHQTIDCPITNADNVVLSGNVSAVNGNGQGTVSCAWKRVTSDRSWRELDIGIGNGAHAGAKFFRRFTERVFVNMSGSMQLTSRGLKPSANISFGNQLSKNTIGYLTYSTNWRIDETQDAFALSEEQSGMATMLVYNSEQYHLMGSLQLGIPYTYAMISVTRKFEDAQNKVRGALKLGTFGVIMEYGVERRVTKHSTLGATMVVGIPVGITLRIKLTRAQQTYIFPIHLADEILMQPVFYGTITPLLAWYTVKKLILDPFEERNKAKEREKVLEAKRARIAETRKEAAASIDLMRERYSRIRLEEQSKSGLVIVVALYGNLVDSSGGLSIGSDLDQLDLCDESCNHDTIALKIDGLLSSRPEVIDVTIPVQCLVEDNSRFTLFEGAKSELAGFFDPSPHEGDQKHFLVRYLYQNQLHQVVIKDELGLKLPKNAHRLTGGR